MDAECIADVPTAEAGAVHELVTGLGVCAVAGTQLCVAGLEVIPAIDNGHCHFKVLLAHLEGGFSSCHRC